MALSSHQLNSYDRIAIKDTLHEGLQKLQAFEQILHGRDKVLLKPNFVVARDPDKHPANTHPDVYLALAELLQDYGKTVSIADSPAFGSCRSVIRSHGAEEECRKRNIDIFTFKKPEAIEGIADKPYERLSIAAELRDYDALINLPKLKVHSQCVFTAATKNLYGCVTGKRKPCRHFTSGNDEQLFARMILRNAEAAAPLLNVGDGITAMHVTGPIKGQPYPLKRLIISDSFLELDWLFCHYIGLPHSQCPIFQILSDKDREELKKVTAPFVQDEAFEVADNFVFAEPEPVRFSARHMLRSVLRSWKHQLSGNN